MSFPSGDHTGARAAPVVRRTGAPPSTGILNRPSALPSLPAAAIHFPSGDQDTAPRTSTVTAKGRTGEPSVGSSRIVSLPPLLNDTTARRPSIDTAGGSSRGPSDPFQISEAWPSSRRHRP